LLIFLNRKHRIKWYCWGVGSWVTEDRERFVEKDGGIVGGIMMRYRRSLDVNV